MADRLAEIPAQESVYGSWKSPITSDLIVQQSVQLKDVNIDPLDPDTVYWSELRPDEAGRTVVCSHKLGDCKFTTLTPKGFNCRTRVHEYGGGAYLIYNKIIYFSNLPDHRMYCQESNPNSVPVAITTGDKEWRYADGEMARDGLIVCVREDHDIVNRGEANEAQSTIVSINPKTKEQFVIVTGCDFYAAPRVSKAGILAWIQWNHPNMPWDSTELWIGELSRTGDSLIKNSLRKVCGGEGISVTIPRWSPEGSLFYIHDKTNWWNLYVCHSNRIDHESNVLPRESEIGDPHKVFGQSPYSCDPTGEGNVLLSYDKILSVLEPSGNLRDVETGFANHTYIHYSPDGKEAFMLAGSPTRFPSVLRLDLTSGAVTVVRVACEVKIDPGYISVPQQITFPTTDGKFSHANFYPPQNKDYKAPEGTLPPLLVKVHGGPTGQSFTTLNIGITGPQYFTSRGFAVLDVNYRGSTGYGRHYREELNNNWGIKDVDDACAGALYLAQTTKEVDPDHLAIDGGSAGGFLTLSALTFRDVFNAGTSFCGISDLELLLKETHKFESRYDIQLVGPYPEAIDVYRARSPIHHVHKIKCPLALFQGDQDQIVPPNQAERMFRALRDRGVPVTYKLLPGEQHFFRKAESIKAIIDGEFYFYSKVFGFKAADIEVELEIYNL